MNKKTLIEDNTMQFVYWKFFMILGIFALMFSVMGYYFYYATGNVYLANAKNLDNNKVDQLIDEVYLLKEKSRTNDQYLANVQKILNGETPDLDSEMLSISDSIIHSDESVAVTTTTDTLNNNTELRTNPSEKFKVEKTYKFYFTPLRGIVSQGFIPQKNHLAVDVVAKIGEPVKSIADGVVLFADWTSTTGYVVMVQHSDNVISVYKHNSQVYKKIGDKIKMGEVIAAVGNTGELTSGPHLHFEIWVNGQPQNPEKYITF